MLNVAIFCGQIKQTEWICGKYKTKTNAAFAIAVIILKRREMQQHSPFRDDVSHQSIKTTTQFF